MDAFIKKTAREAGVLIYKKFGKVGHKFKKDVTDFLTEADIAANKLIVTAIKKKYPTHSIISEETGEDFSNSDYCWIIDPIDGTRNYATGIPLFGVMIGLAYKGEMVLGAIYNPCTDEFVFAKKGKGAYLNGKRIHCSEQKSWPASYGILNSRFTSNKLLLAGIPKFNKNNLSCINSFGSCATDAIYIATGRRDWKATGDTDHGIWDLAMPAIILKEAGCKVTNYKGEDWSLKDKTIVIANKHLHPTLLKIVNKK